MKPEHRKQFQRERRHLRLRKRVRGNAERPRLTVFRSHKHIYAQVVDDGRAVTIAAASSLSKDLRLGLKHGGNVEAAKAVGKKLAQQCLRLGVQKVSFDRGSFPYHGRIKALADAARETGLKF